MRLNNQKIIITGLILFVTLLINTLVHKTIIPSKSLDVSELYGNPKMLDWGIDYSKYNYKNERIVSYLYDTIGILSRDDDFVKTEKIYKHIIDKTQGRVGAPDPILNERNPVEQLNLINKGKSKVWCGTYGFILPYFLQNAGVLSRYISIGPVEGNEIGVHILLEVFIPELNKWILVDPTFNIFKICDKNGFPLSLLEIKQSRAIEKLDVSQWQNDSMVVNKLGNISSAWIGLIKGDKPAEYYNKSQLDRQFHHPTFTQRIIKYFSPQPVYFVQKKPDHIIDNYTIWLISNYILLLSCFVLLLSVFHTMKN